VAAGTINRMVSTGLFDTFTVTNAARAAGGADTEDDDSLKDRCRQFYSTLRRGTLKALEFGARGVAGVANVTASEPGDGTVSLFVSDASGGYSPTLLTDVSTEIENWRAGGVVVNVFGGSIIVVGGIDVSLTLRAGAVVKVADVQNAISGRINKLKIGEDLTTSLIKAAATSVDPDNILGVDVNSPAGTVSAVDGLGRRSIVLRTIPANVSVH
jgi:phage-related baseplate assembly protein